MPSARRESADDRRERHLIERLDREVEQFHSADGSSQAADFVKDLTLAETRLGIDGPDAAERIWTKADPRLRAFRPPHTVAAVEPFLALYSAHASPDEAFGAVPVGDVFEGLLQCANVGFVTAYEHARGRWIAGKTGVSFWEWIRNPRLAGVQAGFRSSSQLAAQVEESSKRIARELHKSPPWKIEPRLALYVTGQFIALTHHPKPTAQVRRIPEMLVLGASFVVGYFAGLKKWPPKAADENEEVWLDTVLDGMRERGQQILRRWGEGMGQKPKCKVVVTEGMTPFAIIQPAMTALEEAGLGNQATKLAGDVLALRPKSLDRILETIAKYVDLQVDFR